MGAQCLGMSLYPLIGHAEGYQVPLAEVPAPRSWRRFCRRLACRPSQNTLIQRLSPSDFSEDVRESVLG